MTIRRVRRSVGGALALTLVALGSALAASSPAAQAVVPEPVGPGLISVSASHVCAVSADGAASCWGDGGSGQLGDTISTQSNVPVPVFQAEGGVTAIDAGQGIACGIIDGAVDCWGNGQYLGTGRTRSYGAPVPVVGLAAGATSLSVGNQSSCAVRGTTVWCWGRNTNGQLGDGTTTNALSPVAVAGLPGTPASVSVGASHACAVTTAGEVWCWGANTKGQLGDGTTTSSLVPVRATGLPGTTVKVQAGEAHTCALSATGQVSCWGLNSSGQLGDGTTADRPTPVLVATLPTARDLSVEAGSTTCAIARSDDGLWCWGSNTSGAVGTYDLTDRPDPTAITTVGPIERVSTSGAVTCILASGGAVRCWGANAYGQLGSTAPTSTSIQPVLNTGGATMIDTGTTHTCVLVDGSARCWGSNASGQLGVAGVAKTSIATPVTGMGSGVTDISAGDATTCAVKDGAGYCWGANGNGQLGDGTTTSSNVPIQVTGLDSGVTAISVGTSHACAVKNGGAYCWGLGTSGQLGNGSTTSSLTPTSVQTAMEGQGVTEVVAGGGTYSCAIQLGKVKCWGTSKGTGLSGTVLAPLFPGQLTASYVSLVAGTNHTCGLTTVGGYNCWGDNGQTQLGTGTATQLGPFGASNANDVGAGGDRGCRSSSTSGNVACWGGGANAGLGLFGFAAVPGWESGVTGIAVSANHRCAIHNGSVDCMGTTTSGQAGTLWGPVDTISTSAPIVYQQPDAVSVLAGVPVSFTARASGSPAPSVRWDRSDDGGGSWSPVAGATSTTLSFTATAGDTGARFRAVFENSFGTATSDPATLTVAPALPGTPGTPTASPADGQVTLSWSAPADDGGAPLTGYEVTSYIAGAVETTRTLSSTATTQTLTGLSNGPLRRFTVAATNAGGTGGASDPSNEVWAHPGLPQVSLGDVEVDEHDGVASLQVSVSKPVSATITLRTNAASARTGADYTALTNLPVAFTVDGPTTQTVPITIVDDTAKEPTETFTVSASIPTAKVQGADLSGTITITDDDGLPAQLAVSDVASVDEGGTASFTVTVRGTVDQDVTVPYTTGSQTATSGVDFDATTGSLSFTAGEVDPVRTIEVPVTDDTTAEGPESFSLALTAVAGLTFADTGGRAWITASDGGAGAVPALARISVDDVRVTEGAPTADVTVRIDQSANATVRLSTTASTAVAGNDFTPVTTTTVTFTAGGPTTQVVSVPITDDAVPEPEERLALSIFTTTGSTAADTAAVITILDDDGPRPQVTISDATGNEGGLAAFLVTLSASPTQDATVTLDLAAGTATLGTDLGALSATTITFPAGTTDLTRVVTVPLTADATSEPGGETFTVKVNTSTGNGLILRDTTALGRILD